MADEKFPGWHGTTSLGVRKNGVVTIAGNGQVSLGDTVIKGNDRKVRRLNASGANVVAGFAGSTADAFTLFERLERKLEATPGQLTRACVELAKDWRTDKYLRNLEAMMIVADAETMLILTGNGDVLEPEGGIAGIGSGGNYALAAARALYDYEEDAEKIARRGRTRQGLAHRQVSAQPRSADDRRRCRDDADPYRQWRRAGARRRHCRDRFGRQLRAGRGSRAVRL